MIYFALIALKIVILASIVALLSKWASWREDRIRDRTVEDFKWWIDTTEGREFLRKLLEEWR